MPRRRSTTVADEAQAIDAGTLMALVNERWPGAMMMGSDPSLRITRIPTGILALDVALKGGFARGRHIELFGTENIGKTTIAYCIAAQAQRLGGTAGMCDLEGTYDPEYAASLGVDIAHFPLHRQKKGHGERAFDIVETMVRRGLDVIIIDTISALLPKAEYESALDEGSFGTDQARLMSKGLRKLTAANDQTVFVWLNQTRQIVGASMFAKQTTTSGGRAMGFYAATRIEMVRTETIKKPIKAIDSATGEKKERKKAVGHRALLRITKDKTGSVPPDTEVPLVYIYKTKNFDPIEDLIYLGRVSGLVHKSSNHWWVEEYEDEKQPSRGKFKRWLRRDPALQDELREAIMAYFSTEEEEDDAE